MSNVHLPSSTILILVLHVVCEAINLCAVMMRMMKCNISSTFVVRRDRKRGEDDNDYQFVSTTRTQLRDVINILLEICVCVYIYIFVYMI